MVGASATAGDRDDVHPGLDAVSCLDGDELPDFHKPMSFEDQPQQNVHMAAINFADQSRLHQHDSILVSMPIQPLPVDPKFIQA